MSILKFESRTPKSLQEMYDYLVDSNKTSPQWIFGIGVNPMNAVNEMKLVQYLYGRYNLTHEYTQIIFCFDVGINLKGEIIMEICVRIGNIFMMGGKRQVLGAIHGIGSDKVHCHYLINYVSIDGALLQQEHSVIYYKHKVNEILSEYGLPPIYYYGSEHQ